MSVHPITQEDPLLNIQELSAYLKVSVRTIEEWERKRIGPPRARTPGDVRTRRRYRLSRVNEWLDNREAGGSGPSEPDRIIYTCHVCNQPIERGTGVIYCPYAEINAVSAQAVKERADNGKVVTLGELLARDRASATWRARHLACENGVDENLRFGYEIDVEQIDTATGVFRWMCHLWEKTWFPRTEWDIFIKSQVIPGLQGR